MPRPAAVLNKGAVALITGAAYVPSLRISSQLLRSTELVWPHNPQTLLYERELTAPRSGIGLAAAKAFAAKGLHIVAVDVSSQLDAAVQEIKGVEGVGQVEGINCDVSQIAQVEDLREKVLDLFGEVSCNCIGKHHNGDYWHSGRLTFTLGQQCRLNSFSVRTS